MPMKNKRILDPSYFEQTLELKVMVFFLTLFQLIALMRMIQVIAVEVTRYPNVVVY